MTREIIAFKILSTCNDIYISVPNSLLENRVKFATGTGHKAVPTSLQSKSWDDSWVYPKWS